LPLQYFARVGLASRRVGEFAVFTSTHTNSGNHLQYEFASGSHRRHDAVVLSGVARQMAGAPCQSPDLTPF
jgi:hypothetical protein